MTNILPTPTKSPRQILVIDDDYDFFNAIQRCARTIFSLNTFIHASSGEDGIDKILAANDKPFASETLDNTEKKFDLVLLDLDMPSMNGFDVLKTIRENPSTHLLPVVVLTNSASKKDIAEAYESKANTYMTKPRLISDIRRMLINIDAYWSHSASFPLD